MCHKGTIRRGVGVTVLGIVLTGVAAAQGINWRRVGNSAVDLLLASPATGPVDRVWFSENGGTLYARTRSGRVFETSDYEVWLPSQNTAEPAIQPAPSVARTPENGARLVSSGFGRVYAMGSQLFRSDDGGRSWANLTAFRDGIRDRPRPAKRRGLAVEPGSDRGGQRFRCLALAGRRTLLDRAQRTPAQSCPCKRILATPSGTAGTRVDIDGIGAMELPPGASVWQAVDDRTAAADTIAPQGVLRSCRRDRSAPTAGAIRRSMRALPTAGF